MSHTFKNYKESIEIAEVLVSPCIQLKNKIVSMDSNCAFRVFDVDQEIR